MSPETAADFERRLEELIDEWSSSESDEEGEEFSLSIVMFPVVSPTQGAQQ
jgi:hypothetical protein